MENKLRLTRMDMEVWRDVEPGVESMVFGESRPHGFSRADFVLVADLGTPESLVGYVTMLELDAATLYWQHGGSFPKYRGSIQTFRAYEEVRKWCEAEGYAQATTFILNENVAMLKMAMRLGFRIIGVKIFKGQVFCHLELKLGGE